MSLNISINNAETEIRDILQAIKNKDDDKIIFDSYDTLNNSLLKLLKEKDEKWLDLTFTSIRKDLIEMLKEKKELKFQDIRNYLESNYENVETRKLIDYIVDLICLDDDIFSIKKNKKEKENDDELSVDENQDPKDPTINIPLEEIIKFSGFRKNQERAIDETKKQDWTSGVHDQIMGAGKTFIILKLIWEHYKKYGGNKIYPIVCYRQEILKDLFFDLNNNIDENKKKLWKKYDIIDLDCFRIIDKINDKNKEVVNSKTKPNILLVNTDFLRAIDKANENDDLDYYAFDYDRIAYLTLDECHGISANNLYDIIKKIKYENKKHIIGFSATVLRDGAEKKLCDIFSSSLDKNEKDKKLNIISRYDFMDAIRDNIIVPPYYTIMEVNKTVKNKIGNSNKKIIEDVLKELFEKLPYKKIICWCRTIQQMKDYYDFFKDIFKEYKIYCSSSHDDILKDKYNIADKEFFDSDGMAIMICVNRFREGSDIKKLDMGVYLDRVKKRTILVAMQTSGRVLRVDKAGKKTHGHIVDCLINDNTEKIEMLTAQLILSYYNKILSLSDENVENKKNLDNYKLLLTKIKDSEYNEKEKVLTVPLDDNKEMKIKLKLTTKSFDWKYLKNILIEDLNKKYEAGEEESLKIQYELLKEKIQKYNKVNSKKNSKLSNNRLNNKEEYKKYAEKNKVDLEPEKKYINSGWKNYYDFLGINTDNFPETLDELKKICKKYSLNNVDIYLAKSHKYGLPEMPEEIYNIKNINTLFKEENILIL